MDWDIQAEGTDAFSQFHLYVCSAFLVRWSDKLREMDFQVRLLTLTPPSLYHNILDFCRKINRASSCFSNLYLRKTGRTTRSRCSSVKPSSSTRYGPTRRAISRANDPESSAFSDRYPLQVEFSKRSRTCVHPAPLFIFDGLPSLALCIIKGKVVSSGV